MFSFHKPKIYRSLTGCCICRAKSSSSRFTDSGKYQPHFGACFHLKEERSGDICNACVLLVKRFRKLPGGVLHQRHWGHVVDARANTKVRPKLSIAEKEREEVLAEEEDAVEDVDDDDDLKVSIRKKKKKNKERLRSCSSSSSSSSSRCWDRKVPSDRELTVQLENPMPSYLDPQLWHRETVCCGTIFRGPMNAIVIDTNLFRPCLSRRLTSLPSNGSNSGGSGAGSLTASPPPPATSPPASHSPDSTLSASSSSSHFKLDVGGDSETSAISFDCAFDQQKNGHQMKAVSAAL